MIDLENAPTTTVNTLQIEVSSAIIQLFGQLTQFHKLFHHFQFTIDNPESEFPPEQLDEVFCIASNIEGKHKEKGHIEAIYSYKNGLIYFTSGGNRVRFQGRFPVKQEMEAVRVDALNWVKAKSLVDNLMPVYFWNWGQHGASGTVRNIKTTDWGSIQSNYPPKTKESLHKLVTSNHNDLNGSGKIILWHGDPGSGKTHALRGLINGWRKWCRIHYIIDPDEFFSRAEYLMSVLGVALSNIEESDPQPITPPLGLSKKSSLSESSAAQWTMLIFEDSGELISTDAKHQTGQALSKLLNLGDGLIGQSLNLIILITTNEDHEHLHPAITREGRCLSNILFEKFDTDGAEQWFKEHRVTPVPSLTSRAKYNYILSDLYAELTKHKTITNTSKRSSIGFAGNGKDADSERSHEIESE